MKDFIFRMPTKIRFGVGSTHNIGSVLTAASVISNEQERTKVSITSDYLIPKMVFVDPSLQLGMPPFRFYIHLTFLSPYFTLEWNCKR